MFNFIKVWFQRRAQRAVTRGIIEGKGYKLVPTSFSRCPLCNELIQRIYMRSILTRTSHAGEKFEFPHKELLAYCCLRCQCVGSDGHKLDSNNSVHVQHWTPGMFRDEWHVKFHDEHPWQCT